MQGKLIIVEGPDECGKTTLVNQLTKAYHLVPFHCTASKKLFPALADYHWNILDNVKLMLAEGHNVILDRYFLSELVYGSIMGRGNHYNKTALELHKEVIKLDCLFIFCSSEGAWNRYKQGHVDPAHSLNEEQYKQITNTYEQISAIYIPKLGIKYRIEIEGNNITEFISSIQNEFKSRYQSGLAEDSVRFTVLW
jgi:thymidylate kinase